MSERLTLILVTGAGFVLGICFFGSLWWTIQRALTSKRPALLFLVSLLLRISRLRLDSIILRMAV